MPVTQVTSPSIAQTRVATTAQPGKKTTSSPTATATKVVPVIPIDSANHQELGRPQDRQRFKPVSAPLIPQSNKLKPRELNVGLIGVGIVVLLVIMLIMFFAMNA